MTTSQISSDCDPIIKVSDIGNSVKNLNNEILTATDPAIPCGLIAKSFFNDNYTLSLNNDRIPINENDIAWDSDKEYKFANIKTDLPAGKTYKDVQWLDMTNGKLNFLYRVS